MKATNLIKAGVSVSVLLWASHAGAQEAVPPASPTVSTETGTTEVIVTASRRSQSLQNTAMTVNVTTGEDLKKYELLDTKDLGKVVPGLQLTNTTGRNNTVTLRGVGFDPDSGTSPTVQVYWNEVPTSANAVFTALYDVGQIEVLKGPQGLLRGLSSPAGAITITTKRPSFSGAHEGYVQATGTDLGAYNAQFGYSMPLGDNFALRVAGVSDGNRVNQVRNVNNGERSKSSTDSARVTLGWRPSDDFTAYFTYQYLLNTARQYNQVFGPGNTPVSAFGDLTPSGPAIDVDDYQGVTDGKNRFKNLAQFWNANLNWDLGSANLSFIGGYQKFTLDVLNDADSANAIPGYASPQILHSDNTSKTAELRLSSKDNDTFGWGISAFYEKDSGTTVSNQRGDSFFGPFPVAYGLYLPIESNVTIPVDAETVSLNANGRYKTGQFTLEGGLRYTISKSTRIADILATSPGYAGFPAFGIPAIPAFSQNIEGIPVNLRYQQDEPITGGLTLSWQPTKILTGYVSYGRSYRSGTAGIAPPAGVSDDLIATHGEVTDALEVGLKGSLFDRRVRYTLAAYDQKIDGYLTRLTSIYYNCPDYFGQCTGAGAPINNTTESPNGTTDVNYNGNAKVQGIDATLSARPTDNWDFQLNASYAHARWDKGVLLPCNDFNGDGTPDSAGVPKISGTRNVSFCQYERLAAVPDFSFSGNTEYRFGRGGDMEPFVRGLVSYKPSVIQEQSNFKLPSTTLIDLFAGVRLKDGHWEITAFVKNILDERKITNMPLGSNYQWVTQSAPYDSGYRYINTTTPREIGITSSYRF